MDDQKHEFDDEPSRSQRKREALEVFDAAEALVALSDAQLAKIPLSDELRALVIESRRITSHIARKRQLQFLAKQMRRRDDELPPILAALAHGRDERRRAAAATHRVEAWRTRLLDEGDEALGQFVEAHPSADRHHLRQLVRRAREERNSNKAPSAARELFRELRELLSGDEV